MGCVRGPALLLGLVALVVTLSGPSADAIQHLNDEFLWTKQDWHDYKLDFPWAARYKTRDAATLAALDEVGGGFETHSLDGPTGDVAAQVQADLVKPKQAPKQTFDVSLLDKAARLDVAAATASCSVCKTLAKKLLQGLFAWVDRHRVMPEVGQTTAYANELCKTEVPVDFLREWVLLRARVHGSLLGVQVAASVRQEVQEFYLLNKRTTQTATRSELAAIQTSCEALLSAGDQDIVGEALKVLQQYHTTLLMQLGTTAAAAAEASEGALEEIHMEECLDRHPDCQAWADKGECTGNPVYMVSKDNGEGWCRRACGECTPKAQPSALSSKDATAMAGPADVLLTRLVTTVCTEASPCNAGSKSKKGAADSGVMVAVVPPAADPELLLSSAVQLVRPLDTAAVPSSKVEVSQEGTPPETPATPAAAKLHDALNGQCHYLSKGWWSYQLCYQRHLTQYHSDPQGAVDWAISLGAYASTQWAHPGSKTSAALFPGQAVRYIPQYYDRGNACKPEEKEEEEDEYDDGEEEAAPAEVVRQTEVQLMCSPDDSAHVLVSEPSPCRYLIEWYLPALCGVDGFRVYGSAPTGQGGGGEGSGAEAGKDTAAPPSPAPA